ncbi:MAG TPA: methyltransferase domain-containing protein [Acidisphaera sp.]|nr:methyltransferase domain-containing protein [Acidisphaera sp.]
MSMSFVREFVRDPAAVGALAPSSRALARTIVDAVDLESRHAVLELGPGTGAFTAEILRRLRPAQRYLGIERNPAFHAALCGRFGAERVALGDAADLDRMLRAHGIAHVDGVVCSLPWASLPAAVQDRVFAALGRVLTHGGLFATFAYLQGTLLPGGRVLRQRLSHEFASVRRSEIVWANLPPAFVYICRK